MTSKGIAKSPTPMPSADGDKPKPKTEADRRLELAVREGESWLDAQAAQAQDPVIRAAALATAGLLKPSFGTLDLMGSVRALQASVAEVQSGDMRQADAMLVAQANTLDSVFAECLRMWLSNQFTNHGPSQDYLRMAMKAQSQARATWESLSKIKNPMGATFVRQANIANGPQQVNNGSDPSRTGNIENKPNELLESGHGERMDTGTTGTAGSSNPTLETVGAIHRPAKRSGQGSG